MVPGWRDQKGYSRGCARAGGRQSLRITAQENNKKGKEDETRACLHFLLSSRESRRYFDPGPPAPLPCVQVATGTGVRLGHATGTGSGSDDHVIFDF